MVENSLYKVETNVFIKNRMIKNNLMRIKNVLFFKSFCL